MPLAKWQLIWKLAASQHNTTSIPSFPASPSPILPYVDLLFIFVLIEHMWNCQPAYEIRSSSSLIWTHLRTLSCLASARTIVIDDGNPGNTGVANSSRGTWVLQEYIEIFVWLILVVVYNWDGDLLAVLAFQEFLQNEDSILSSWRLIVWDCTCRFTISWYTCE